MNKRCTTKTICSCIFGILSGRWNLNLLEGGRDESRYTRMFSLAFSETLVFSHVMVCGKKPDFCFLVFLCVCIFMFSVVQYMLLSNSFRTQCTCVLI
jgi:hypothetical protein